METTVSSVRPFEQFVLLTVVELDDDGGTPVQSHEVTELAKARMDTVDRPPFGGIERQEVISALGVLADEGLLEKTETEDAVGKGRPAYDLAVAAADIRSALVDAETVGPYAESLDA